MVLPVPADSGQQLAQRDQARPGNRDGHDVVLVVGRSQHVVTEGQREAVRVLVHERGVGIDVHSHHLHRGQCRALHALCRLLFYLCASIKPGRFEGFASTSAARRVELIHQRTNVCI